MAKKKGNKKDGGNVQINFWASIKMRDKIAALADKQDRSMASLLRLIVSDYVLKSELEKGEGIYADG